MSSDADTSRLVLRDATRADLTDICAIVNHEIEHGIATLDLQPWQEAERGAWLAEHSPKELPLLVVAQPAGSVIAWGCLSAWSPKAGYQGTCEISVFVHRKHRGMGLGRELLSALLARGQRAGQRNILARIVADNEVSLGLFRSCGFKPVGTMHQVGIKFGRLWDVVLLEYLVAPKSSGD